MNTEIDFLKNKGFDKGWVSLCSKVSKYADGDDYILVHDGLYDGYVGGLHFENINFSVLVSDLGWDKEYRLWDKEYRLLKRKEVINKILNG